LCSSFLVCGEPGRAVFLPVAIIHMASIMRSVAVVVSLTLPVDSALAKMTLFNKLAVNGQSADGSAPSDSAAARTLLALDLNHDGLVDSSEVAAFAKSQGYDAAPTTQEFMGLDANHDGSLDMMELSSALSVDAPAATVESSEIAAPIQQAAVPSKVQPLQLTALPVVETPAASSALLEAGQAQKNQRDEPATAKPDAQAAAALIARELSIQDTKEKDARFLDRKAADLRANSTALTRQTVQRVLEAGSKAASSKTAQLLQTLSKLEDQAEEAEVQAAALRAKSRAELEQASDFMSIANAALGTPDQGTPSQGVGLLDVTAS